ncbi:MAG: site-specific tyrosine recombinase XerD [Chitinophagaceae bacterium]
MLWLNYKKRFKNYLDLEKGLSKNSTEAYMHDVEKFEQYIDQKEIATISRKDIEHFLKALNELGIETSSQMRILSGLKSFFKFCIKEHLLDNNPFELIEFPKATRKLPDVLSLQEIQALIDAIPNKVTHEGCRNVAILETLYGCGLRVSELVNLKISMLRFEEDFIIVIGKGNKERLVPINHTAQKFILLYLKERNKLTPKIGNKDILFLNRRGGKLSRQMIFIIIRTLAQKIQLKKSIHPHTFRHSFATHLIERGANLRIVQEMLGHESITTTEIYTHLDRTYLRKTMEKYHPLHKI